MTGKILDFKARKEGLIEKKRRSFERLVFQNFLGAYSVIKEGHTIYPITLVDISQNGALFQIPWSKGAKKQFEQDSEITVRMYFSDKNYIPVVVKIKYGREYRDPNGSYFMRYGCEFDKSLTTFKAMEAFINFMYKFAEYSSADKGDTKAFFL